VLYSESEALDVLAQGGILGERNAEFLEGLAEGAVDVNTAVGGGEATPQGIQPRQLVIVASEEERAEIVGTLQRLRAEQNLPTMTQALLWALRTVSNA
jgi:hypothetical protein